MLHVNAVPYREGKSLFTARGSRRVLVIAQETHVGEQVRSHLERLRVDVTLASNARQGLATALTCKHDLIIVDHARGLEICRALRAEEVSAALLVLPSTSSEAERILALGLGADDWLCRPFNAGEALLRCRQWDDVSKPIEAAGLVLDPVARRVTLAGREVRLTSKEYDLLYLLASQADRVFTRTQLLTAVWKPADHRYEHAVSCHINRLRLKIEADARKPRYIMTVWGVGYRFSACARPSGSR